MNEHEMPGNEFLRNYLRYEDLTRIVTRWAEQHPEFVRLRSIAQTHAGRDVWMLELGKEPDRLRPAIWIDGNMHSAELLGTNGALDVARVLIELHEGRLNASKYFSQIVLERALDCLYYIVPSMSPDGAEGVLNAGRLSRSAPRQRRGEHGPAHWIRSDLDGDGRILQLRLRHPSGEFVEHPAYSHVLVPRTVTDDGPFYKVLPEGYIDGFDGKHIPAPHALSDNDSDFNRNFAFEWSGDGDGAGAFPGWEPETRAIMELATRSPHIFAWLNLHTFGGIFIRPPFSEPDKHLSRKDLLVYEDIAQLAATYTGMSTVSAFADMTPVSTRPMRGTLAAWAYGERGCLSWAVELWDLFAAAGLSKKKPFFRNYAIQRREEWSLLVEWDAAQNGRRIFNAWRPFPHPQLGDVEIGGIDPVRGLLNPPEKMIIPICTGFSSFALILASLAPCLKIDISTKAISSRFTELHLSAVNSGYLPTYITVNSLRRIWNHGIKIQLRTSGCELVSGLSVVELGHLGGWGRGADEEANGPFFQQSQGGDDISVDWVIEGSGDVEVEIGSPRLGWRTEKIGLRS
jgi:Zinc carboxypeptidase